MNQPSPMLIELVRRNFKYINRFMLLMWRLDVARWLNFAPHTLGRYMVIVHTGRKSGLKRHTPVNYTQIGDDIYCVAGFGHIADWYRNMLATPEIEIWLPTGWWQAKAEEITAQADALPILRAVLVNSGFAAVVAGVNPHTLSDAELHEKTKDYRLMRITRTIPQTGTDGPGGIAWIWQLISLVLLILLLLRPMRSQH